MVDFKGFPSGILFARLGAKSSVVGGGYMRKVLFVLCLLSLIAIPALAVAIGIEVGVGVWSEEPSGTLSYKPVALTDNLDLERDLKYDTETRAFGRVKIDMPLVIPNIYIMATPMSFKGRGSKTANFSWGGKTYDFTQPFDSELSMDHLDIAFFYGIPGLKKLTLEKLNLELGLNARLIDFYAEVSGTEDVTGNSIRESKSLTIPIPMIYAGIQVMPIKKLSIEAEGRGIAYGGDHYYSLIGRLKVKTVGPLFIAGGYRYDDIKFEEKDINAEVKFQGPFAEVGLKF